MYEYNPIKYQIAGAERAAKAIERKGVLVYIDSDPDFIAADFHIDPNDEKGLSIFREFAAKMAEHYKTLTDGPGNKA